MKNRIQTICMCLLTALVFSATEAAEQGSSALSEKIDDSTFTCIRSMAPVRGFYVDNLLGNLEETLKAANSADGGEYPPGSVVQLVPAEVMVKLEKGAFPATKDWEFFELDVGADHSRIKKRGFVDVVNQFGGNCFACHAQAKPQWDMICEKDHGCDPIPLSNEMIQAIQKTDPRCAETLQLNAEEKESLHKLKKFLASGSESH